MRLIRNLLIVALCVISPAAMALDCSGTITTGNTAQTVFSSVIRRLVLMNNSASLMCISWNSLPATIAGTNCGAGSWALQPGSATLAGGSFTNPPDIGINTLSIISANTGDRFSCERQ